MSCRESNHRTQSLSRPVTKNAFAATHIRTAPLFVPPGEAADLINEFFAVADIVSSFTVMHLGMKSMAKTRQCLSRRAAAKHFCPSFGFGSKGLTEKCLHGLLQAVIQATSVTIKVSFLDCVTQERPQVLAELVEDVVYGAGIAVWAREAQAFHETPMVCQERAPICAARGDKTIQRDHVVMRIASDPEATRLPGLLVGHTLRASTWFREGFA